MQMKALRKRESDEVIGRMRGEGGGREEGVIPHFVCCRAALSGRKGERVYPQPVQPALHQSSLLTYPLLQLIQFSTALALGFLSLPPSFLPP